ncbi:MAG: beta-N-acetylhexosaminidase [Pseudomonadota bacterium]
MRPYRPESLAGRGATILGVEGFALSREERDFLRAAAPFGFILFARNIESPEQVRSLCASLRDAAGYNAPVLIDQEGGRVQRLRGPVWREWLPPLEQVTRAGARAEEAMYARYRIIAHELCELGIDANCAPCVDLAQRDTHPFLKNRCYADTPSQVVAAGRAVARGLLDGGVLPVVKHVPGHGGALVDSHHDLPRVERDAASLQVNDFAPFKALADLPMAMTAHIVFPALDSRPATLSQVIVDLIRDELDMDGLLMTDDISMKALSGEIGALSRAARAAGCDVVLHCNGDMREMRAVVEQAGTLEEDALRRAEAALAVRLPPREVDIPALESKLAGMLDGNIHV